MGHIMAQVAVLQMNIEMRQVIAMKLKKKIRDFSYTMTSLAIMVIAI